MTQTGPSSGAPPTASFHVRVAKVGLITALVGLAAACTTFMLQQWAVARTQSHQMHEALASLSAGTAAGQIVEGDRVAIEGVVASLAKTKTVQAVRLDDAQGHTLSSFSRGASKTETEVITKDAVAGGKAVGRITLVVARPALAPLLPQFIALTFTLLFGGIGVSLFLARSLAHKVIQPVQTLSEAMHEVAAGGSFTPIEDVAKDELFRSLTGSFNHLLGKLGEREEDLKSAMRDLEVARDQANAANVLKTQFLANMSHEIRTPLNVVLAMAEVMSMGELAPVQRDRLAIIRQSGSLLLAVLNDVLDLSKIEAGKLTLIKEDFELEPALSASHETFQVLAQTKNLQFAFAIADEAKGWWRGDADRIKQIVGNLLSNAVKFTPQGTVSATVDLNP